VHYGIIGYPLAHSFSPAYFRKKFASLHLAATYDAFPLPHITDLPTLLAAHPHLAGLNVTLPHKEAILPYLHIIEDSAAVIGAVNCVAIKEGVITGYNTDATGFEQSIIPLLTAHHTQALILGTGGSSRAVAYVLTQLGIPYTKVSGSNAQGAIAYSDVTPVLIEAHKLIVNTTPMGMYPLIDNAPALPYNSLSPHHLLYDLIYNPEETRFLAHGRTHGAATKNGFEMLQLQAEASWDIWSAM